MEIRPILATLRRHKLTATLLALQVAFTCAIITNAVFLIVQRVERISVPSGLDENELSVIRVDDLNAGKNPLSLHQADLAALRRIPGVKSAAIINHVPFESITVDNAGCGSLAAAHALMQSMSVGRPHIVQGCAEVGQYSGGPGTVRTLGLKLIAGRTFHPGEYVRPTQSESRPGSTPPVQAIIISQAAARTLFPLHPDHVVGRVMYYGMRGLLHGHGTRVVGVVANLHGVAANGHGPGGASVLIPVEQNGDMVRFALRSPASDRTRVLKAAVATLVKRRPQRTISAGSAQTYAQIRAAYFSRDTTMIDILLAAAFGLLFVTALGVAGLASFWVQQRTRSIGIRRALGATRLDILRYFQTENFLIVTAGIVLGVLLAVGLNLLLLKYYAVPHLPLWYLAVGAVALWVLGQLAVLAPALRASYVSPAIATRSV